jgi:hypothetical protein
MVVGALRPTPCEQGSRTIQLPYLNTLETIWEYDKLFLCGHIDFFSYLGPTCPICGDRDCYRQITPYWRYAIELFPGFRKKRIPIARFLCRRNEVTFSLLPIQLIPYFQYTVAAVIGVLFLGFKCWQMGQRGFFGASLEVDPDSDVTPYLVFCWLKVVLRGFRRAHPVLGRFYDLSDLHTSKRSMAWEELSGYFLALGLTPQMGQKLPVLAFLCRYSLATKFTSCFLHRGCPLNHRYCHEMILTSHFLRYY